MLIYPELTFKARKAIFNVYNSLGYGHKEQIYHKALLIEFEKLGVPFKREVSLKVFYDNKPIGLYRPDFIIDEKIIIEIKACDNMSKNFETQLINYLKSTNFQLGLLVNFGSPKLFIKRLIWTVNNP